jgi:hypothetical protein
VTSVRRHGARCFGTDWLADLPLGLFDPASLGSGDRPLQVKLVASLADRKLTRASPRMQLASDGFRFRWNDEAVFDCFAHGEIKVLPGSDWRGALPESFYSTVVATMLAWQGMLPLHMSSVVLDGRAWLLGGASGAGKSTLTAELVCAGAQFLADDLSLLRVEDRRLLVTRGRPWMRLYPFAAARVGWRQSQPLSPDGRGKLLVWPCSRAPDQCFPIGGIIMLGHTAASSGADKIEMLARSVFRYKIVSRIPSAAVTRRTLLQLASTASVMNMPSVAVNNSSCEEILARIDAAKVARG